MRTFWPPLEAAQVDYEALRELTLVGGRAITTAAKRFERVGLAGLILRPVSEPTFNSTIVGASRPLWTPYHDPRQDVLGKAYELLLSLSPDVISSHSEVQR